MHADIIDKFKAYYGCLPPAEVADMDTFYAKDVHFQDPVRKIGGLEFMKKYHESFVSNLKQGGYKYTQQTIMHDKAYLSWELDLEFKIPKKRVTVTGIAVLVITDKIISHRNYYDAGAMFYENLPLIGPVIRSVKRQLGKYC